PGTVFFLCAFAARLLLLPRPRRQALPRLPRHLLLGRFHRLFQLLNPFRLRRQRLRGKVGRAPRQLRTRLRRLPLQGLRRRLALEARPEPRRQPRLVPFAAPFSPGESRELLHGPLRRSSLVPRREPLQQALLQQQRTVRLRPLVAQARAALLPQPRKFPQG